MRRFRCREIFLVLGYIVGEGIECGLGLYSWFLGIVFSLAVIYYLGFLCNYGEEKVGFLGLLVV